MGRNSYIEQQVGAVLLTLRAGSIDSVAMAERINFDLQPALREAVKRGFVVNTCRDFALGSTYAITQAGKNACPKRRDLFRRPAVSTLEQPTKQDLIEMGLTA